jgi:hypothetical protein
MGDENKLTIEGLSVEEYANISIASNDYWNDMITVVGGSTGVNYDDWLAQYDGTIDLSGLDIGYPTSSLGADDIKLTGGGEEMLRISEDGFYVNGVKVKQGKSEAKAVYEAFKRWMTHAIMSGELDN